ncbi:MAG: flavin reductase [Treponema sp.]|nr:flavin reductase [Treponema sp.]
MNNAALYNLSYGLYIIGTKDGNKNAGCVVNTVIQATSQPVTVTVCINKDNYTNACVKKTGEFSVSILSENAKPEVFGIFGFNSSRDKDKFAEVPCGHTPSGLPYLKEGVTGFLQCKVIGFTENYTHTIFIGEVKEAENLSSDPPMTYAFYHKVVKGKTPKNAPGFSAVPKDSKTESGSYKCGVCGHVFTGSKEEFDKLPDDYRCPICGAAKGKFIPVGN